MGSEVIKVLGAHSMVEPEIRIGLAVLVLLRLLHLRWGDNANNLGTMGLIILILVVLLNNRALVRLAAAAGADLPLSHPAGVVIGVGILLDKILCLGQRAAALRLIAMPGPFCSCESSGHVNSRDRSRRMHRLVIYVLGVTQLILERFPPALSVHFFQRRRGCRCYIDDDGRSRSQRTIPCSERIVGDLELENVNTAR
jgi:hypothetical protein